jgi:hypothetical protein
VAYRSQITPDTGLVVPFSTTKDEFPLIIAVDTVNLLETNCWTSLKLFLVRPNG